MTMLFTSSPSPSLQPARQHYIDWLRILATLAVFLFHSARMFDFDDWHIKNSILSEPISIWTAFLAQWIMPILFAISGLSSFIALRRRTGGQFLLDRIRRLLVPLVFGTLIIVPPQVYLERLTRGLFSGSLLDYYPHYFDGLYLGIGGPGNFAWMGLHLWYLLFLFVFSLIALPLLLYLRREDVRAALGRVMGWAAAPGGILLVALIALVPLAAPGEALDFLNAFGGWQPLVYLFYFLLGYLIPAVPALERGMQGNGWLGFIAACIATAVGVGLLLADADVPFIGVAVLRTAICWFWIVALFGLTYRYLNFDTPLLQDASEAVLPFYILHQTVIVIVGWLLLDWVAPVGLKYLAVILISFPVILWLYVSVVRPIAPLRFLFGMRTARATSPATPQTT